jgi:hypothetical protein
VRAVPREIQMKAQHTEGPWAIIGKSAIGYEGSEIGTGNKTVAVTLTANKGEEDDEEKANASLIAAAPDLLAALYEALPYVTDAADDPAFKKGVVSRHVERIRKAIAKAGGEE